MGLAVALIAAMPRFGAVTAAGRARGGPRAFWPLLVALAVAGSATLGLVVAPRVFPARPRYPVPVGGIVIGNAMTAAAVALNRLGDDVADGRRQIEARLALGATGRQAIASVVRRSLRSGVIPLTTPPRPPA
jgi:putative ABC transport system permease protein